MAYDPPAVQDAEVEPEAVDDSLENELIELCSMEMRSAIGFENDAELIQQRERATLYRRGVMTDMPKLPNRSGVTSSDVSDAVLTVMPDLIDIFTGGDDVLSFSPENEGDVDQAEQETDCVKHTIFNDNDGWMLLYTCLDDALVNKTALAKYWWDEGDAPEPIEYKGQMPAQVGLIIQDNGGLDGISASPSAYGQGLFDVTVQKPGKGNVCIAPVDPNDFAICRDATNLHDATYCVTRSRPRAQDLIAQGIDEAKVNMLETWSPTNVNASEQARDTIQETQQAVDNTGPLRQVYVCEHYIKLWRDGKMQRYQVLSDYNCSHVLRVQKVNRIQLSVGTAFINAHRFYGRSLADLLIEVQRIKTFLMRMVIDSGLYAINGRPVVSMDQINEFTLNDLLNNIPGAPIRVNGPAGSAIEMGMGGEALNYNALEHLEYFSTVGEQRTGVIRNAQGLNPDSLHDTAAGAAQMAGQAQKRIRMMARALAETFVKGLYLGVHSTMLENATDPRWMQLRGSWVQVNPSDWEQRNAMTVEVGVGAANMQHELMAMQAIGAAAAQMVEAQGGINGPLQNPQSLNSIGIDTAKALGKKNPQKYFPDPQTFQPPPPQPDPKVALDTAKLQQQAQESQGKLQLEAQKHADNMHLESAKLETEQQRIALEHMTKLRQYAIEGTIDQQKIGGEFNLKAYQLASQNTIAREQMVLDAAKHVDTSNLHQQEIDNHATEIASGPRLGGDKI